MRVVIAGGTGFLGRPLSADLAARGHDVIVLARRDNAQSSGGVRYVTWSPDDKGLTTAWASTIDGADAVVNLAGEGIADKRWTIKRKAAIRQSRVTATRALVEAIRRASKRPAVLVNASGIGYYGDCGDAL